MTEKARATVFDRALGALAQLTRAIAARARFAQAHL